MPAPGLSGQDPGSNVEPEGRRTLASPELRYLVAPGIAHLIGEGVEEPVYIGLQKGYTGHNEVAEEEYYNT